MRQKGVVIALDVGGSSVKSGVVGRNGRLFGEIITTPIDSRGSAGEIFNTFAGVIKSQWVDLENHDLLGVAFGFPGPFDYERGVSRILGVEKFESIFGLNVGEAIRDRMGVDDLPVRFRNDAEAAIVGEARFGVGRPFPRIIGVTLGTGCGSAFLVDGEPVANGDGVPENGWLYPVPFRGRQADDVFSIRGFARSLQEAGITGGDIITAAEFARGTHEAARTVFSHFGHALGEFLQPWVDSFRADAVLVQGGIANAFDLFGPALNAVLSIPARKGVLGEEAALLGGAALF